MPEIRLAGCHARPLADYLKALGILRIVAHQVDSSVRGRWHNDCFELRSPLSEDELAAFLLDRYVPTPVVSPWNGGSGFHPKDNSKAVEWIASSDNARFTNYRETIDTARRTLASLGLTDIPRDDDKVRLVRTLRGRLSDEALEWLDSAIVVVGGDAAYPPLLGSGGNDGRFDFSNNFAQALVHCLREDKRGESAKQLTAALSGETDVPLQKGLSLGHFVRDASPVNSPAGGGDSLGNPWDLILSVEGALVLTAGSARRHASSGRGTLVAPFTVYPTASGYGSAVPGENSRAELWLPLWRRWLSYASLRTLARESRARVAKRSARTGLDMARAASLSGVADNIDAFDRYAIVVRAGQSSLTVPVERVEVVLRPAVAALNTIDGWLAERSRLAGDKDAPAAVRQATRRVEGAAYRFATTGTTWAGCDLIEAIGAAEHQLARSAASLRLPPRPLKGVPAKPWIEAADDGTPEFSVATSLASLHDPKRQGSHADQLPILRDLLHGTTNGGDFGATRRSVAAEANPYEVFVSALVRRHRTAIDGQRDFHKGTWCNRRLAGAVAEDALDMHRVARLTRGLVLFDHYTSVRGRGELGFPLPAPLFDLVATAWHGAECDTTKLDAARSRSDIEQLRPRASWAALLANGAVRQVVEDAHLRLRMAGLDPGLKPGDLMAAVPNGERLAIGRRLATALMLPLSGDDVAQLVRDRLPSDTESEPAPASDEVEA